MPSLTKIHADFVGPLSSGTASSPILKFGDSSTTGIFSPNTGEIAFSTSGQSQAVTFKTDGKVGIGINSPAYNLDVIGDINFTGTLRQNGSAFSGGGGGGGGGGSNWTTSGNNIYRQSKVGINQNNPTDNLEILHTNGNGITFKTSQDHYAQITSDVNRTGGDSFLLALEGKWNGTPVSEIALVTGSDTTNKDDGEIIFRTSSQDNLTSNERLRITSGGLVRVPDNGKFVAGGGDDLQIYHDGDNSYIDDTGAGRLNIRGNTGVSLRNYSNSNQFINCYTDGTVELFYNNIKKLETTNTGVTVTGTLAATAVTGDGSGLTSIDATTLDGESKSYYTGYTDTAIANLVDSSPGTLNTLNELAAALGDDASFSTTVTNSIAAKLPLAGGTMTGTLNMGSNNITTTGKVLFANMYSALGDLPNASTYHGMFAHVHGTGKGYFAHGGNWIRLLDTNDEGSGNGLDADTVDGQEGSYYLNYNNFTNTPTQTDNNFTTTLKNKLDGIESSATADQTAAEILTAIKTVDGASSGLDSDTLDGLQGSVYLSKGSSSSYYQPDNWIDFNTTNVGLYWAGSTSAGWHIYPADASNMRFRTSGNTCALRLDTNNGTARGSVYADNSNNIGFLNNSGNWRLKVPSSGNILRDTYTIWDSGNDGTGSGLDADTVDGIQGASLLRSDADDTYVGNLTFNGFIAPTGTNVARNLKLRGGTTAGTDVGVSLFNGSNNWTLQLYGHYSASTPSYGFLSYNWGSWDLRKFINGELQVRVGGSNYTVWHTGNDGGGSGLDADLLDGQQGTYYLDYNNLTNVPAGGTTPSLQTVCATAGSSTTTRVDVGGLTVDSNLTPTSGTNIEIFYGSSGGVIQSYDRDNSNLEPLRVRGSGWDIGYDGSITFDNSAERKINIGTEDLIFWDSTNNKQIARVHYGNNSVSGSSARGQSAFIVGIPEQLNYTSNANSIRFVVEGRSDLDGCQIHGARHHSASPDRIVAVGTGAITYGTTSGDDNTACGASALNRILNGEYNTGVGSYAGSDEEHGDYNVFIGSKSASHADDENYRNTLMGFSAGYDLNANDTVIIGAYSAYDQDQSGSDKNTYVGAYTAYAKRKGGNNTLIGYQAGRYLQNGNNDSSTSSYYSNTTCLGYDSRISGSNQLQLGNSSTTSYAYGSVQNRSDARDKTDIRPTILGLDFIKKLNPVDFRWDYRDDYTEVVTVEKTKPSPIEIENPDGVEPLMIKSFENVTETIEELRPISKDGSKARTRFHHGLIAQDVKTVMDELDIDFAGYQDHNMKDGLDVLSIGYTELIGPMIKAIQEQQAQIEALTAMIESMK